MLFSWKKYYCFQLKQWFCIAAIQFTCGYRTTRPALATWPCCYDLWKPRHPHLHETASDCRWPSPRGCGGGAITCTETSIQKYGIRSARLFLRSNSYSTSGQRRNFGCAHSKLPSNRTTIVTQHSMSVHTSQLPQLLILKYTLPNICRYCGAHWASTTRSDRVSSHVQGMLLPYLLVYSSIVVFSLLLLLSHDIAEQFF